MSCEKGERRRKMNPSEQAFHIKGLIKTIRMALDYAEKRDLDAMLFSLNLAEDLLHEMGDCCDPEVLLIKGQVNTIYLALSNGVLENDESIAFSLTIAEDMLKGLGNRLEKKELGSAEGAG